MWGEVDLVLWSKDVKYCQKYTCRLSGKWTLALISSVTFSEGRLGSASDSNMAAAAITRVHVLARPSVWQADDFDVLNISFTQKCLQMLEIHVQWSRNSIVSFYFQFFSLRQCKACIYEHCQLSNHGPTDKLSMVVSMTVLQLLLSCLDWPRDSLNQNCRTCY